MAHAAAGHLLLFTIYCSQKRYHQDMLQYVPQGNHKSIAEGAAKSSAAAGYAYGCSSIRAAQHLISCVSVHDVRQGELKAQVRKDILHIIFCSWHMSVTSSKLKSVLIETQNLTFIASHLRSSY